MESRYELNKTKNTSDGRLVYKSKIYPNIPLRDDDIYVATELGIHNAVFALTAGTILRIPKNYIQILSNIIQ